MKYYYIFNRNIELFVKYSHIFDCFDQFFIFNYFRHDILLNYQKDLLYPLSLGIMFICRVTLYRYRHYDLQFIETLVGRALARQCNVKNQLIYNFYVDI